MSTAAARQAESRDLSPLHGRMRCLSIALLGYRSNPYSGGQGIYIAALARALTDTGHRVDVISGPPYPELDDDIPLIRIESLDLYAAENHVTALRPRHFRSTTDLGEYFSMLTGGFPEPWSFGRRVLPWLLRHGRHYDVMGFRWWRPFTIPSSATVRSPSPTPPTGSTGC